MALGHLVLSVPHDGGAVNIGGDLPAEGLVQQVILGGGGQILAAPHHMGDAHQVVVDDVGEVIGGQTVPLQQHLIVQRAVVHGDVPENGVVEGGGSGGDTLADDVGQTCLQLFLYLLGRQLPAGIGGPVKFPGILLRLRLFAEAVVGAALFHQQPGVLSVGVPALGLDIGGHGAAYVRTFVMGQAALGHGAVDDIHSALHLTALVGVLDPQDKRAVVAAGDEPGVQRRPQIAHVHIAGGGGGEPGADLSVGDLGLHFLEIAVIQCHGLVLLISIHHVAKIFTHILYFTSGKSQECLLHFYGNHGTIHRIDYIT